jgi:hypothetical protein
MSPALAGRGRPLTPVRCDSGDGDGRSAAINAACMMLQSCQRNANSSPLNPKFILNPFFCARLIEQT